ARFAKRGGSWPRYAWKSGVSKVTCMQSSNRSGRPKLRLMATRDTFTIVQISDLHCGTQFFLANLPERPITEVNALEPEIVICSGDLTTFGFKEEYALAKDYLDRFECDCLVV